MFALVRGRVIAAAFALACLNGLVELGLEVRLSMCTRESTLARKAGIAATNQHGVASEIRTRLPGVELPAPPLPFEKVLELAILAHASFQNALHFKDLLVL